VGGPGLAFESWVLQPGPTARLFGLTMTDMPFVIICCLIPLVSGAGLLMGRQVAKANRRRMKQYRASPESHILNLRD
jgi:hypothetical protein